MSQGTLALAALAAALALARPAAAYDGLSTGEYALGIGAIVAIVLANVLFWGGLIGLLVWGMRRRQRRREKAIGPVPLFESRHRTEPALYEPVSGGSADDVHAYGYGGTKPAPAGNAFQLSYDAPSPAARPHGAPGAHKKHDVHEMNPPPGYAPAREQTSYNSYSHV